MSEPRSATSKQMAIRHAQFLRRYLLRQGCELAQTPDEIGLFEVATFLESLPDETTALHPSLQGLTRDEQRELIEILWRASDGCERCAVNFRKLKLEGLPPTQETKPEPQATSMDYGGVGQVGCEGDDGLLRIHRTNETCDVCSSQKASASRTCTLCDKPYVMIDDDKTFLCEDHKDCAVNGKG